MDRGMGGVNRDFLNENVIEAAFVQKMSIYPTYAPIHAPKKRVGAC